MTDQPIAALLVTLRRADESTALEAARELHRRGVSVVGCIPVTRDTRPTARVDAIPDDGRPPLRLS